MKTGVALGRAHANYDEIIDYIRKNLPKDRFSIVHGDFKFDNVVCDHIRLPGELRGS